MKRVLPRLADWLRRYLPAELAGTPSALFCAWAVDRLTGSTAAAAVAATWGENLGFYGLLLARELRRRGGLSALPAALRDLTLEFGPAEALDRLLLRPALIYIAMLNAPHPALGVLVGKLAADLAFYVPTIASYELLRRRARAKLPRAVG